MSLHPYIEGASPDAPSDNPTRCPPIVMAAAAGNGQAIAALLDGGADIAARDALGKAVQVEHIRLTPR